ncbi:MAG TPA: endonuclease/exonuclease/phosphatase family protein [Polyangia bacterium]|jgi:endonuclease/exonuclease/phosphatase (EEP) superfamily protein YafD
MSVEIAEPETRKPPRLRRPRAGVLQFLAIGYLFALVAVVAVLRLGGERWWLSTVALYLPRVGFGFPLPFVVAGLLWARSYRLLLTQLACAVIVLFPLMGLGMRGRQPATPGAWRFRVFTANIGNGAAGSAQVVARARSADPDLIVLEEVADTPFEIERLRAGLAGYAFWSSGQFAVASRFPIEDAEVPPPLDRGGRRLPRNYARLRLLTPAGPIRLYAVHPISPHSAFDELRGAEPTGDFTDELLTARVFDPRARAVLEENTERRVSQVRALADDARQSPEPVLIAGDTNLPGLSWALATLLGDYHDAFADAGRGFGYTYPTWHRRWLRIDRLLGGPRLRFLSAASDPPRLYDHLPLTAEVELLSGAR